MGLRGRFQCIAHRMGEPLRGERPDGAAGGAPLALCSAATTLRQIRGTEEKSKRINALTKAHVILTCGNTVSMVRAAF
jgi:hypothetical protein